MKTAKEVLDGFYHEETLYIAAKSSGDPNASPSAMLKWLAPDLVVAQSPDLPWGGEWKGPKGFGDWAAQMGTKFSKLEVQNPKIYVGDEPPSGPIEEVLVRSTLNLVVSGTGEELSNRLVQIVKVDREKEQITEIVPIYWDVGGLNDALRRAGHI